jgi:hypothetical protein
MRNRHSVITLILLVVVVVTVIWIVRTKLSPSSSSTPPNPAETTQERVGPADIYPNPLRTPGATNPDIEQANIQETICNPRWSTKSIRPPSTYTSHLKVEQIREFGYDDTNPRDYEEDHLIPLELGGDPTDPKNIWPEPLDTSIPDGGAMFKDKVENHLHAQVCAGNLTLEEAQKEISAASPNESPNTNRLPPISAKLR